MPAQPGAAIRLNYGTQPADGQVGSAIVLDSRPPVTMRTLRTAVVAPWAVATPTAAAVRARMEPTRPCDRGVVAPWLVGVRTNAATAMPWRVAQLADRDARVPWGRFQHRHTALRVVPWSVARQADRGANAPWGIYGARPKSSIVVPWSGARPADHGAIAPWGTYVALALGVAVPLNNATPADHRWISPWLRYSRQLNPGWGVVVEPGGPPVDENGTVVIPKLRTYIVINDVSLRRVSNDLALPPISMQIDIDVDSWGWGWSCSMATSQLANLERDTPGEFVELEAMVNGDTWRLLVERITRDRRFGQDRIAVSGRGIAAQLADPIYPAESRDNVSGAMTAQQLAAAALSYNGVPLGWDLDWQIADWLVPAGAWVHTGTPMDAVTRIAAAAGGYVQADPATQVLHVLPRYPLLPWEWGAATPDIILPADFAAREGIEYLDQANYNAVYVSGGAIGGILAQVKIAGTAADRPAEMITDPLITHVDAARGRGAAVLGNTGRKQMRTIETPILPDVGIHHVGKTLEWQEGGVGYRGVVRATGVNAALPKVRQTLEVECNG